MDLKDQFNLFISRHKTIAWVLVLMGAGLLLQGLLYVIFSMTGQTQMYDGLIKLLVLPSDLILLLRQPWSIITFPFFSLEFNILKLLVNGLILWAFGRIHQQLMGDQRTRRLLILAVPIIGILTASLSSFTTNPYVEQVAQTEVVESSENPVESSATSADSTTEASATEAETEKEKIKPDPEEQQVAQRGLKNLYFPSGMIAIVMVLVLSSVTLVPAFQVQLFLFGRVKILWIGVVLLLLELSMALFYTPLAIAIAIGSLLGFLHVYLMRREIDITEMIWSYYSESNRPKMTVAYKSRKKDDLQEAPVTSAPKSKKSKGSVPQETVDKILDKISEKGYESLSREEKEILYKASSQKEDE
ncbi:MAG: DUF6576 domain-containing protein [Bacteroidia bacterium]|nr:DUF6576 domain-containing protein [Bacteroidia bacterium]